MCTSYLCKTAFATKGEMKITFLLVLPSIRVKIAYVKWKPLNDICFWK